MESPKNKPAADTTERRMRLRNQLHVSPQTLHAATECIHTRKAGTRVSLSATHADCDNRAEVNARRGPICAPLGVAVHGPQSSSVHCGNHIPFPPGRMCPSPSLSSSLFPPYLIASGLQRPCRLHQGWRELERGKKRQQRERERHRDSETSRLQEKGRDTCTERKAYRKR